MSRRPREPWVSDDGLGEEAALGRRGVDAVSSAWPIVLLGLAGFCFGGAYALVSQKKPWWVVAMVVAFGLMCLVGGWLYL